MSVRERIIVALDGLPTNECLMLVRQIGGVYAFKVEDLWDREGPGIVQLLKKVGAPRVWVDLKLHSIPHTVGLRAQAVRDAGADILTVHASGGIEMMEAAVEHGPPTIFAITVLTSLSDKQVSLLYGLPAKVAVFSLACLAGSAGVHGIVSSLQEVGVLAKQPELEGMELVVAGIRPAGTEEADQKRVNTPAAAIKAGASRLVIGRPITQADDPIKALNRIAEEIASAAAEGE